MKRALCLALLFFACSSENENPGDPPTDAGPDTTAGGSGSGGASDSGGILDAATDGIDWCAEPFCPNGVEVECCNCMQLKCNAQYQACRCSEDCRELEECLRLCNDPQCAAACYDAHPEGTPLFASFTTCGESTCYDECFAL